MQQVNENRLAKALMHAAQNVGTMPVSFTALLDALSMLAGVNASDDEKLTALLCVLPESNRGEHDKYLLQAAATAAELVAGKDPDEVDDVFIRHLAVPAACALCAASYHEKRLVAREAGLELAWDQDAKELSPLRKLASVNSYDFGIGVPLAPCDVRERKCQRYGLSGLNTQDMQIVHSLLLSCGCRIYAPDLVVEMIPRYEVENTVLEPDVYADVMASLTAHIYRRIHIVKREKTRFEHFREIKAPTDPKTVRLIEERVEALNARKTVDPWQACFLEEKELLQKETDKVKIPVADRLSEMGKALHAYFQNHSEPK